MRTLLVSRRYSPEPSIKTPALARELVAHGHDVEVVTTFPNYPLGRTYDGYKQRTHQLDRIDGVSVHRVPFFPDHSRSAFRRMLSYLSFGWSARWLGGRHVARPDIVWAYHPPLPTLWAGAALARRFKVPLVVEIQDMWPETLAATGMADNPRLLAAVGRSAKRVYDEADAIIVLSNGFKHNLITKGVPADKIHVLPNWADSEKYPIIAADPTVGAREGMLETFDVVFAGNMGKAQQLDVLIQAAALLQDLPDLRLTFIGSGIEEGALRELADDAGAANVRFLGRRPEREMAGLLAHADLLIVHLKKEPLFAITIPSKILAYLAAGKPIVAAVEGDAADVVEDANAGTRASPGDPVSIAATIRELYMAGPAARQAMGERGRRAFEDRFTPEVLVGRYADLFETLTQSRSP